MARPPYIGDDIQYMSPSSSLQLDARQQLSEYLVTITALMFGLNILMWFMFIKMRRCFTEDNQRSRRAMEAMIMRRPGLDPAVVNAFPTAVYRDVKRLRQGNGESECAVCLGEFEEQETIRLMPNCNHGFHVDCIDIWLSQHVTCPLCRTAVRPQPGIHRHVLTISPELNSSSNDQLHPEREPRHQDSMAN